MSKKKSGDDIRRLASNRKASFEYFFLEKYIAGISLLGTEVKSCRNGGIQLRDAFIRISNGEAFLTGASISGYSFGGFFNHDPLRDRKLLLNKREIRKLASWVKEKGSTIIPLNFLLIRGLIKVEIAVAKGKRSYDKRVDLKNKAEDREAKRFARGQF